MISKPLLIGGAVAVGALLLLAGSSKAAQGPTPQPLPPGPEPTPMPPQQLPDMGPVAPTILPETVVYGDPAAVAFSPITHQAAIEALSRVQAGEGAHCTYSPAVHAFQIAYNLDPTSKHPENVLGTYNAVTYALSEDGKFGDNSATAAWYVTGNQLVGVC